MLYNQIKRQIELSKSIVTLVLCARQLQGSRYLLVSIGVAEIESIDIYISATVMDTHSIVMNGLPVVMATSASQCTHLIASSDVMYCIYILNTSL